jgi:BCD family chlorophyll transporter-like MFS transporter
MAVLAVGGALASVATAAMTLSTIYGTALAVLAFLMIGLGAGACGTSLLVLLAREVAQERRAAAASLVWIMMIAGFAVTAGVAGHFLDPFSPARLIAVTTTVSASALLLTVAAIRGIESGGKQATAAAGAMPDFRVALREIWQESEARRFTLFVFISMLAYSAQDLILEPFAGTVFGMTPGESTQLAGVQHGGVLIGMLMVAAVGSGLRRSSTTQLRHWTVGGCLASALALAGLTMGGQLSAAWPLAANVFALGVANGAFAVAAIASMMNLAGNGTARREGLRMGLWGAAQAIAFAIGGFMGTAAIDLTRSLLSEPATAYGVVFAGEAGLFLLAAWLGAARPATDLPRQAPQFGDIAMTSLLNER